jgi:MoaA/NifB/PqqE/SkfB family radical SAM enzyme
MIDIDKENYLVIRQHLSEMEKPYDAWLQWSITRECNLNCPYCYQKSQGIKKVARIDIDTVLKTLKQSGKTFKISFSGGEPFLVPNFIELCSALTIDNHISIISNLVTGDLKKFSESVPKEKVEIIIASFHITELRRLGLIDAYVQNFHLLKKAGYRIITSCVAHPSLARGINMFKRQMAERGIRVFFTPFVGDYENRKYPESYTPDEMVEFELSPLDFRKYSQEHQPCNAGFNVGIIEADGTIHPCQERNQQIGNIYSSICFEDSITTCPAKICACPLKEYDEYLFLKSLE